MCFIAFTFINHIKNVTKLQYRAIVKALDGMQLSEIKDDRANTKVYLRSKIRDDEQILTKRLKLKVLKDAIP